MARQAFKRFGAGFDDIKHRSSQNRRGLVESHPMNALPRIGPDHAGRMAARGAGGWGRRWGPVPFGGASGRESHGPWDARWRAWWFGRRAAPQSHGRWDDGAPCSRDGRGRRGESHGRWDDGAPRSLDGKRRRGESPGGWDCGWAMQPQGGLEKRQSPRKGEVGSREISRSHGRGDSSGGPGRVRRIVKAGSPGKWELHIFALETANRGRDGGILALPEAARVRWLPLAGRGVRTTGLSLSIITMFPP